MKRRTKSPARRAEDLLVPSKRTDLEHRVAVLEAKLAQTPSLPTVAERLTRVETKLGLPAVIQMCQRCHHIPASEIVEGTKVCVRCAPLYRAERERGRGALTVPHTSR